MTSQCIAVITTLSLKHSAMAKSFQFRPSNSAVLSYYCSNMIHKQDEGQVITDKYWPTNDPWGHDSSFLEYVKLIK